MSSGLPAQTNADLRHICLQGQLLWAVRRWLKLHAAHALHSAAMSSGQPLGTLQTHMHLQHAVQRP